MRALAGTQPSILHLSDPVRFIKTSIREDESQAKAVDCGNGISLFGICVSKGTGTFQLTLQTRHMLQLTVSTTIFLKSFVIRGNNLFELLEKVFAHSGAVYYGSLQITPGSGWQDSHHFVPHTLTLPIQIKAVFYA